MALIACETAAGADVTGALRRMPDIGERQTTWRGIAGEPFAKDIVEGGVLSLRPAARAFNEGVVGAQGDVPHNY